MFVADVYRDHEVLKREVPIRERLYIGRAPENDLPIEDPSVSRRHALLECRIEENRRALILRDLGSTNGTFVNERRISECAVEPGDEIRIGSCRLEIRRAGSRLLRGIRALESGGEETVIFAGDPFAEEILPADRLRELYEFAVAAPGLSTDELLAQAAATIERAVESDAVSLLLEDDFGGRKLVWRRGRWADPEECVPSRRVLERCFETRAPIIVESGGTKPENEDDSSGLTGGVHTAMCTPLLDGDHLLGLLYCAGYDPLRSFSTADLQFVVLVAAQVAALLAQRRLLEEARVQAAKLEAILEGLQESVLVCDEEFRVLEANLPARKLFGSREIRGLRLEEILASFEHTFDRTVAPVRRGFELEGKCEVEGPYKTGSRPVYSATINTIEAAGGTRHVLCVRDITERRREECLKSIFVNQLAHKLRTPLTVIGGVTTLLSERLEAESDPEIESLLQLSEESCRQISELIDRFVEFASLGLRGLSLRGERQWVPLAPLIEEALKRAQNDLLQGGLRVLFQPPPKALRVYAASDMLLTAFVQVIQNAAKFAGSGCILSIECVHEGRELRLRFTDDGKGIPSHEVENVFSMFHQVDRENTGQVPGAGLGLWWTREVVRAHGGDVRIESPPEGLSRGTRVSMVFPARFASYAQGLEPAAPAPEQLELGTATEVSMLAGGAVEDSEEGPGD